MEQQNHMQVIFDAKSENEGLARMLVTAFMSEMNPTLEQIADVKTAVSEAVTNAMLPPLQMHYCSQSLSMYFHITTFVPSPAFERTSSLSMKASINANPIPDRSSCGFVV